MDHVVICQAFICGCDVDFVVFSLDDDLITQVPVHLTFVPLMKCCLL